jgi:hypothetical protein
MSGGLGLGFLEPDVVSTIMLDDPAAKTAYGTASFANFIFFSNSPLSTCSRYFSVILH